MKETVVSGEICWPAASHWQTLSHNVRISWAGFELTTLVVIGTDYTGSCKSNYHTITTTMALIKYKIHYDCYLFITFWCSAYKLYIIVYTNIYPIHFAGCEVNTILPENLINPTDDIRFVYNETFKWKLCGKEKYLISPTNKTDVTT